MAGDLTLRRLLGPVVAMLALAVGLGPTVGTSEEPSPHGAPPDLLAYADDDGHWQPVRSAGDWQLRRQQILQRMQEVMGPLPGDDRRVPLDVQVESVEELPDVWIRKVTLAVEPGDRLPAYLVVPKGLSAKAPAAICLHPTSQPLGKAVALGRGPLPNRGYAMELARRGYVTVAPDYPNMGEYQFDPYAHGYVSATMKGIWNHMRAVDLLQSLDEVDGRRIVAIGHSLGGHNSLFLAAFDVRIRAVVTSCGFCAFGRYYGGDLTGWSHAGYMPRIASDYGKDPKRMPFDFPEVLAAIAPRPVFVSAPLGDDNFDVAGVRACVEAVRPVYALLGADSGIEARYPEGGHDFPDSVRQAAYAFLDAAVEP